MFFLETQTTPCGKPRFRQNSYCFVMLFQRTLWLLRDVQGFARTVANSCLSKMGRRRRLDAFGESKHGVHTSILALISQQVICQKYHQCELPWFARGTAISWFQFHNHVECSHFAKTSWGMNRSDSDFEWMFHILAGLVVAVFATVFCLLRSVCP